MRDRPGKRLSRSKSATNNPSGSPTQSETVTMTWSTTVVAQQGVAQPMFVPPARPVDAALVLTKRLREESRLDEKSGGAAIVFGATERFLEERGKPVQPLRLPAHLIVEPKHFCDEA